MNTELAVQPVTPMDLIERASAQGAAIEQMQQLFELKLRVEADEARKSFNAGMAKFKANPPQINKNKHVKFGNTEYDHATLDHVVEAIAPALSRVGIRHNWRNDQSISGEVSVTCVLTHEAGHSESTTLKANYDTSGSKNGIQAIASTVTYLQRYTLLGATGLAALNTDNDGAGHVEGKRMPEPEVVEFLTNIEAARNLTELQSFYVAAYKAAQAISDQVAMKTFIAAKNSRKAELS